MQKRFLTIVLLTLFIAISVTPLWAADGGAIFRIGQDILVLEGEQYDAVIGVGNNMTIGGTIRDAIIGIGGNVKITGETGDVILIGANGHLANNVNGAVIVLGSNITLEPEISIAGDVVLIGSNIIKGEEVQIRGSQVEISIGNLLANAHLWGPPLLAVFLGLVLMASIVFALLTLLAGLLFPTGLERSRKYVLSYPGKCFLVGLILFIFFIPINIILLITIIGITMLPLLWLIYGVLAIWGISVIAKIIGAKILSAFNYQGNSEALPLCLGIFAFYLLTLVPVIGWLIMLVIKIMALGLSLLTHLGFREDTEVAH